MAINPNTTTDHRLVKTVHCTGSPYEIGFTYSSAVSAEVHSNIKTYSFFFDETVQITWKQARERAVTQFVPTLEYKYPEIIEEIRGIATGAGGGLTWEDILTLNVRSEIALTNYTDGYTSISQSAKGGKVFLAQNWDWLEELKNGIVFFYIKPIGSDIGFKFLSEAGIVGKIGMNNAGFGLYMNAIRVGAFNKGNFPVYIMLQRLLQYAVSFDSAIAIIEEFGVTSTINCMLGDKSGKYTDIECSPYSYVRILSQDGYVAYTNYLYGLSRPSKLLDYPAANSITRLVRIQELTDSDNKLRVPTTFESLRTRLSDKEGNPFSICRNRPPGAVGIERITTLSTIIMELTSCTGKVTIGRPYYELPVVE